MAGRGCKIIIPDEDMARAEEYAKRGHKNGTIGTLMGWDDNLIAQRPDIKARLTKKRAEHKDELLAAQHQKALKGDTTMLIWCGKQHLGQTDRHDLTSGGESLAAPVIERSKNRPKAPETRENT